MTKLFCAMLLLAVAAPAGAAAQSAADSAAIRQAALDYAEGWYAGDAARMEAAVHPDLAKRIVETDGSGRSRLSSMGAMELVQMTRGGGGRRTPREEQVADICILDIYHGAASVRVRMAYWVDYLHVGRFNGRWVIVNALWEEPPTR